MLITCKTFSRTLSCYNSKKRSHVPSEVAPRCGLFLRSRYSCVLHVEHGKGASVCTPESHRRGNVEFGHEPRPSTRQNVMSLTKTPPSRFIIAFLPPWALLLLRFLCFTPLIRPDSATLPCARLSSQPWLPVNSRSKRPRPPFSRATILRTRWQGLEVGFSQWS